MSPRPRAWGWWTIAGAGVAGLVLAAVALVGQAAAPSGAAHPWQPPCTAMLGPEYAAVDVETVVPAVRTHTLLVGLDRSPSNADLAQSQLDAGVALASDWLSSGAVGLLFVSDRSDRSSTPDLPLLEAAPPLTARAGPWPCAPNCDPSSLVEQTCRARLDAAMATRVATTQAAFDLEHQAAVDSSRGALEAWAVRTRGYRPRPGTSLMRFWAKVAAHPHVRRAPGHVTIVLLSDLEEAKSPDRRAVSRFRRELETAGETCPEINPLPAELEGVRVVLLQTITDGVDADAWGRTWEGMLRCRGARVTRTRYGEGMPAAAYLTESRAGS